MPSTVNFVILEPGSRWAYDAAPTLDDAAAKLGALMLANPARWAAGGIDTWERWQAEREAAYLAPRPQQITAERWDDMLNVLPPLAWTTDGGVNRFNMSEFESGQITSQYGRFDGIYLHKYVRHGDRSTYLTPLDFQPGGFVPMTR